MGILFTDVPRAIYSYFFEASSSPSSVDPVMPHHQIMTDTKVNDKPFTVAVFCGSKSGTNPAYLKAAADLAHVFHKEGWNLVYGGGTTGIMGEVSKTLVSLKGPNSVHGIIPSALSAKEQANLTTTSEKAHHYGIHTVVADMHTRKRMMAQESNAFIALPGGYGTAEELFEIVTWNQLGIHGSPIILLNIEGFWDGIVEWVRKASDEEFVSGDCDTIIQVANTVEEVPALIASYKPAEARFNLTWGKE
ncbi:hypothetical protein DRE_01145 [Drechslerella stenobrocha 248]|uniref:Uncharacterized protein n=1 Tax=Drechslerella stenobrocha 248 TaxID=1043628 RepID=W7HMH6_9PEZI|nr:hypothetical protein DRE_01145 [Drechslerella stenobrocha 248]